MLNSIKTLGINSIELGYNLTHARFNQIVSLAREYNITIDSVHNFCPLPPNNPSRRFYTNYFYLSSTDAKERECAVVHTKQTIDTAAKIGAKVVIIHAGTIEIDSKYPKFLASLYNQNKINSIEGFALRNEIMKLRNEKKQPHIDAIMKSLSEITAYAAKANIKIGLENRYYPNEIPDMEEAAYFLEKFHTQGLVYWHDVGHAQAQERLGTLEPKSLPKCFNQYLYGFHLHDLKGLHDHLAPLSGDFDFMQLDVYLKQKKFLKVFETHQPASFDELKRAIRYFSMNNWL